MDTHTVVRAGSAPVLAVLVGFRSLQRLPGPVRRTGDDPKGHAGDFLMVRAGVQVRTVIILGLFALHGSGAVLRIFLVLMRCVHSWDTFVPITLSFRIKDPYINKCS